MYVPLAMVASGKKVKIKQVISGFGLKKRLHEMGLCEMTADCEGAIAEVVKNDFRGPIILRIFDSRLIIGRGQAQKIMVEEIS